MAHPEQPSPMPAAVESARTNWAGNYTYRATGFEQPASVDALQQLVLRSRHAKAVGTRHSFNHIADTDDVQIDLTQLKTTFLDAERRTVTIGSGVTYGELAPYLDAQGFGLGNLASLPHISVAGACATGTHGSGIGNGCLATSVVAMELIRADGNKVRVTREYDAEVFRLAAVGLGALGVVTSLTLALVPTFQVAQTVYENLSFDQLEHNLQDIFGAAYSVSLFTDWQQHRVTQAWLKQKVTEDHMAATPKTFFGATRQTAKLHPLPGLSAENCTEQLGVPGPWYERLPHFRLDYTPSAGAEIQTEYFVPLDQACNAIRAVEALRDRITPHLLVSELRVIAADDLLMSMCCGRASLALHFTWKQEMEAVRELLPSIEAALKPYAVRPHWAKLFTMPAEQVRPMYPQLADFARLSRKFDPQGRFRNSYLEDLLGI